MIARTSTWRADSEAPWRTAAAALLCGCLMALLVGPGAEAALKKYALQMNFVIESTETSPNPDWNIKQLTPDEGARAVIDDAGPNPVLKTLVELRNVTVTTDVPALGGFIFTSNFTVEGPSGEFTGTGSTDTSIAWGVVTGWTITGTTWCHSAPAFICDLASMVQDESIDPVLRSPFYDLGTWTFHGTGWVATPFIDQNFFVDPGTDGNLQLFYRGTQVFDGTVPALPLLGTAILGASVLLAGLRALRRRRE